MRGCRSVTGRCCSLDDVYDARAWRRRLGFLYYVESRGAFERDVVRPFVEEYLAGRTPIPFAAFAIITLKFDQLLIVARQIGAEKIATAITPSRIG